MLHSIDLKFSFHFFNRSVTCLCPRSVFSWDRILFICFIETYFCHLNQNFPAYVWEFDTWINQSKVSYLAVPLSSLKILRQVAIVCIIVWLIRYLRIYWVPSRRLAFIASLEMFHSAYLLSKYPVIDSTRLHNRQEGFLT